MQSAEHADDLKPLTSLRFVAAMMIVLVHALLYFKWSWLAYVPPTAIQGVSFFFVLSGFILTHVYQKRQVSYGQFMWARVARLWPLHLVTLALLPLIVPDGSVTFDGPGFFSKWWALASNITLTQSLIPFLAFNFSWNGVAWSISTEMFFYLAFPLLLLNIQRTWHWKLGLSLLPIFLASIVTAELGLPQKGGVHSLSAESILYASPFMRIFEFCLGMACYVGWQHFSRIPLQRGLATFIEATVLVVAWLSVGHGYGMLHSVTKAWPVLDQWLYGSGSCWAFAAVIMSWQMGKV